MNSASGESNFEVGLNCVWVFTRAKHSKQREEHMEKYGAKIVWCIQGNTGGKIHSREGLYDTTGFQIKSTQPYHLPIQ